eukprot:SAG11_NODE_10651_length_814_cov_1.040559_1_plen_31_part_10
MPPPAMARPVQQALRLALLLACLAALGGCRA